MMDVEIFAFNTATHPLQIHYSLSFHTVILLMYMWCDLCFTKKKYKMINGGVVMWLRNTAWGTGTRTIIILHDKNYFITLNAKNVR